MRIVAFKFTEILFDLKLPNRFISLQNDFKFILDEYFKYFYLFPCESAEKTDYFSGI